MVLCLGADDTLYLPHWGALGHAQKVEHYLPDVPLNRPSEATFLDGQPQAYPIFGMPTFKEPCLVIATDDGARGSRFSFVHDDMSGNAVELTFEDNLTRAGAHASLRLERAFSPGLPLPPDEYDLLTLTGQWAREFECSQRPLPQQARRHRDSPGGCRDKSGAAATSPALAGRRHDSPAAAAITPAAAAIRPAAAASP
jgi:alpha-galactosidase